MSLTLSELLANVAKSFKWPSWRINNTKTAITNLAKGLGTSGPDHCHSDNYYRPIPELIHKLNIALKGKGSHFVNQQRNYTRYLFKQAESLGLAQPLATTMAPRLTLAQARAALPKLSRGVQTPYRLKQENWPLPIQEWWKQSSERAAARLRPITLERYTEALGGYLGFLKQRVTEVDDLYRESHFDEYIRWHAKRAGVQGFTSTCNWTLKALVTGKTSDEVKKALHRIRKMYPLAPPLHDKGSEVESLTLRDLERVGRSLLEWGRTPVSTSKEGSRNGLHRNYEFREGLMLRLLVRIPMRQRCLREMNLSDNLTKDRNGIWKIRFKGLELKIAWRGREQNVWQVRFPADLIPDLEEYLDRVRPCLLAGQNSNLVFMSHGAGMLSDDEIRLNLLLRVFQYTKRRFYPHLIRTIWPTEMSESDADIRAVAYMMNDRIETILKKYYAHTGKGLQERAEKMVQNLIADSN